MKILSSKAHGILDYLFAAFLLLSPTLFGANATPHQEMIMYGLGGVHLLLTILTNFELGLVKAIPFRIHGLIELIVAIGLGALAIWFRSGGNGFGFYYFMALALTILVVFNITDFRNVSTNTK